VLRFCPLAIMVSCAAGRSRRSSTPTLPDLHAYHESGLAPARCGEIGMHAELRHRLLVAAEESVS
jgi:hypothetical protein